MAIKRAAIVEFKSRAGERHSRHDAEAAMIEAAGRRAMNGGATHRMERVVSDRRLPLAPQPLPRGVRVIQSGRGVVALANSRGEYLGLFATE